MQEEKAQSHEINAKIEASKKEEQETLKEIEIKLNSIGNIVAPDVVISNNEEENKTVAEWGKPSEIQVDGETLGRLHHHEIMEVCDIVDFKRGQKVAGHRGFFLKGDGVLLN